MTPRVLAALSVLLVCGIAGEIVMLFRLDERPAAARAWDAAQDHSGMTKADAERIAGAPTTISVGPHAETWTYTSPTTRVRLRFGLRGHLAWADKSDV